MKRLVKIIVIFVPAGIIVALIVVYFSLNVIVERGIEKFGSEMIQTDVKLKKSRISLFSGQGSLKGLFIGNPEGFKTKNAFKVKEIHIKVDSSSVFSDKIIIESIIINAPEIIYEMKGMTSNIKTIQNNVQRSVQEKEREKKTEQTREMKKGKTVQINDFIVKDGKICFSMSLLNGKKATIPLPEIHLRNIGAKGKDKSAVDVFDEAFFVVTKSIFRVVACPVNAIGGTVSKETKKTFGRVKSLF